MSTTGSARWTGPFLASLALSSPAAFADGIEIASASRRIDAWAYGYDYEFDNGVWDTAANAETSGPFDETAFADLFDWYGAHVGTGSAGIESLLASDRIHVALAAEGNVDNASIYTADAGGQGRVTVGFDVPALVRVAVAGSAQRIGEAFAIGDASLARADGAPLVSMYLHADPTESVADVRWLSPDAYSVSVFFQAWAFGGSGATEIATGGLDWDLSVYAGGDFDLDGDVDPDDLAQYLSAFAEEDDTADVDGDGVIAAADRDLFWGAWRDATLACPGDLDAGGAVDFADLLEMLGAWGACAFCPADLDDDGSVGFSDLLVLLAHWGVCGE